MPRPAQDTISPVAPDILIKAFMPSVQLGIRLSLALLVLAYAYFVPATLVLTSYSWFALGIVIYMALQSVTGMIHLLHGANRFSLHAVTVIDIAGTVCVLLNDPQTLPPTLLVVPVLLLLASIQHTLNTFLTLFGLTVLLVALAIGIRDTVLDLPLDAAALVHALFLLAASAATTVVAVATDRLRLKSALVTDIDPLTGLGNRWTFYEAAKYLLPYHQRNLTPMVIMFAELELAPKGKKQPSRATSDFLVKQFASIIDQRVRASDIAVRYGQREFAFLLADTTSKEAESVAYDLQQAFNNWAKQKEFTAFAHIGLAVVPVRPIAVDQILININAALFRAKQYRRGVSGAVFADPEQN